MMFFGRRTNRIRQCLRMLEGHLWLWKLVLFIACVEEVGSQPDKKSSGFGDVAFGVGGVG